MLTCQGREMGVRHEVASRPQWLEQLPHDDVVAVTGVDDDDRRLAEPAVDGSKACSGVSGSWKTEGCVLSRTKAVRTDQARATVSAPLSRASTQLRADS